MILLEGFRYQAAQFVQVPSCAHATNTVRQKEPADPTFGTLAHAAPLPRVPVT
jgi:hypothetical protein